MKKSKYTLNGDAAFDKMLDQHLGNISEAIKKSNINKDIVALVLGGGYGRGEGGVFETSDGQKKLYNDLDFFVIVENLSRFRLKKINKTLMGIGESFSREIGIDVDFGPAKTLKQLPKMPFTMMWQELREGHVLLYGDDDALELLPDYDLHALPRSEGVRLLLNRGVGLLLARRRFKLTNISIADRDFIGRNLYKAVLAYGDILLLLKNQYCLSVQSKLCLLEELGVEDIELYRQAVRFKLSPQVFPIQELTALQERVMIMFEKTCLRFFSVCYNFDINNLQELHVAFKGRDVFEQDIGGKEIIKNYIKNFIYMRKLDNYTLFSSTSPRLRLLQFLLDLLFEHYSHSGYTNCVEEKNFLECWNKLN